MTRSVPPSHGFAPQQHQPNCCDALHVSESGLPYASLEDRRPAEPGFLREVGHTLTTCAGRLSTGALRLTHGLRTLRPVIPVFRDLPVFDAKHVEPRRCVAL